MNPRAHPSSHQARLQSGMATSPGLRRNSVQTLGAWLHPTSANAPGSAAEHTLQFRAGLIALFCVVTGLATFGAGAWRAVLAEPILSPARFTMDLPGLAAAAILVVISVFAPHAVFRTRAASDTRAILSNPSLPIRPWRSTTLSFDAVLVGGMLAGLYYSASFMVTMFGLALIAQIMFTVHRRLETDPNARFHVVTDAWVSGVTAIAAFLIVRPLAASVEFGNSVLPLVLAGLIAMYLGLAINAVQRWITSTRTRWAFARDAVDSRRIVVALVSAGLAWTVAAVGDFTGNHVDANEYLVGSLAGLGTFIAGWLLLWWVSIVVWRRDATRTLAIWSAHQTQIVNRLADGSLSADLAVRASLPVTTRMAITVFGATRALTVVEPTPGEVRSLLVAVDQFDSAPPVDATALTLHPNLRLSCSPLPGQTPSATVTIASWLWPGWFMTRSRALVDRFVELATETLLLPIIATTDDSAERAFATMFDPIHRWPTLTAFEQAVDRMRARADASPHSDSLVIGVYEIDGFGALSGGRFEQAAVAQVVRLALGHPDFAGHDLFVAYEAPGRLWVALAGGPVIRSSIALLRGLQERINDRGAVPSARVDVDIEVSVSFGYGAHQVDDFTRDGLMSMALERLAIDASHRSPFEVESLLTYDIRPEDIIGEATAPVTAVDLLERLRADRLGDPARFPVTLRPITETGGRSTRALWVGVGWEHTVGQSSLVDPDAFASVTGRQPELAAEAALVALDAVVRTFASVDAMDRADVTLLVAMPPALIHPESNHLALPNLVAPVLDRRRSTRTAFLLETVPQGAGQAIRLLADQGINIALTAAAAAGADAADLYGWHRWAVVFPRQVIDGPGGLDALMVQQTVSAIANHETHLIGLVGAHMDQRELLRNNITWVTVEDAKFTTVSACLEATAPSPR